MAYATRLTPVIDMSRTPNPNHRVTTPVVSLPPVRVANPTDPYAPVRAQVEKPVKIIENVFGTDFRADPHGRNSNVADSFKQKTFGRDRMMTGSLPYATSPRLKRTPLERMVPMDTHVPFGELKEALSRAGPFYLRRWQIWDNAPFLPSNGDVSLDPRYSANQMKHSTTILRTRGR